MPALQRAHPFLGRKQLAVAEDIGMRRMGEEADLIDPATQIGGHGDVGRGGDHALRQRRARLRQLQHKPAEALLGGHGLAGRERQPRHRQDRSGLARLRQAPAEGRALDEAVQPRGARGIETGERLPFLALDDTLGAAERLHLGLVHQSGVIVLMPGEGEAPALDRIGDEAGGPVGRRRLVEGLHDGGHVMAAEIGHQAMQRRIVMGSEHPLDAEIGPMAPLQLTPEAGPAFESQSGIEIVGAIVDPALQGLAARARRRPRAAACRISA